MEGSLKMRAHKYLVTLVIILLVNKSLARPEQSSVETSTPKVPAIVLPKNNDTDMQRDSTVNYNFHASNQVFYVTGPWSGRSSFDDVSKTANDCPNGTHKHADNPAPSGLSMSLVKLGKKRYYFGIFFKVNWFKASQYCRYHGMHLVSIASQEENDMLEKHIKDLSLGDQPFWTSGTDLADEGTFFWMANGRPITFKNWLPGEPNNVHDKKGIGENCLEMWNKNKDGFKWNDRPCSWQIFFICEEQ